jgi:hypothetical protein
VAKSGEGVCVRCGAELTAATSYLSETGSVCLPCFARIQNQQAEASRTSAAFETGLTRRARLLGGMHGATWAPAVILAAHWVPLPSWLSSALLLGVGALVIGLALRRRPAYVTALLLDAGGALALLAAAARHPGKDWPIAIAAVFPLALAGLTRALRAAYLDDDNQLRPSRKIVVKPWMAVAVAAIGAGAAIFYGLRRPAPPDPALELMRTALPRWQVWRARPGANAAGPAAQALLAQAATWPRVAGALGALDVAWPDNEGVRVAVKSVNQALADARLPFFINTFDIRDRPYVLSYRLEASVPWRIGERTVDVLRLQRVDTMNIELGLLGSTEAGLPVVMLDRIESSLARDLPAMYGKSIAPRSDRNDFDRVVLERLRTVLEARLGPGLAAAAAALGERDRLVEEMRTRLRGNDVQLALPDAFILGDAWLASLEPEAALTRPGGPLVLDTDLKAVARADRNLRDGGTLDVLRGAVNTMALVIEAHEARHALDEVDPVGPPPPALFQAMPSSSTPMIASADRELRAILGELHDGALPVCATLGMTSLNLYGRWARRNPHSFATAVILKQLDPDSDLEPAEQLTMLCSRPDADLRSGLAAAWQKLYGAPMPRGERVVAARAIDAAR